MQIGIDYYDARDYLRAAELPGQPRLQRVPAAPGGRRAPTASAFSFNVQFRVYDGDPAPAEVTFERELYLRDALQYEGFDVGDVVSARVTEVALLR